MEEAERFEAGAQDFEARRPGETPRFLALHREAMVYGLPLGVGVSVMPLGLFAFMLTRNPVFGLFLWAGALLVLRALSAHDPNFVRVLGLALDTRLEVRNRKRHGGTSFTPLPASRPVSAAQVPVRV